MPPKTQSVVFSVPLQGGIVSVGRNEVPSSPAKWDGKPAAKSS